MSDATLPTETELEGLEEAKPTPAPKPRAYVVKNFINDAKLREDISYSMADLSNAMQQQAALYIEYGRLEALAARQVDDLELVLSATEASAYRRLKDQAVTNGVKITEAALDKMMSIDARVVGVKRALNEARQIAKIAKAATEGFKQRRDMLIQHGATEREERKGELRTLAGEDLKQRVLNRIQSGKE